MLSEVIVYFYYLPAIKILGRKYAYFECIPFCAFSYFQTPLQLHRPNAQHLFTTYIYCVSITCFGDTRITISEGGTIGRTPHPPTPAESHEMEEQRPANSITHTMCLTLHTTAL